MCWIDGASRIQCSAIARWLRFDRSPSLCGSRTTVDFFDDDGAVAWAVVGCSRGSLVRSSWRWCSAAFALDKAGNRWRRSQAEQVGMLRSSASLPRWILPPMTRASPWRCAVGFPRFLRWFCRKILRWCCSASWCSSRLVWAPSAIRIEDFSRR